MKPSHNSPEWLSQAFPDGIGKVGLHAAARMAINAYASVAGKSRT